MIQRAALTCIGLIVLGCPAPQVDLTGTWQGTLFNSLLGEGDIAFAGIQTSDGAFAGEFIAEFDSVNLSGTISGQVTRRRFRGTMLPLQANTCPGVFEGDAIEGGLTAEFRTFQCAIPQTGVLSANQISTQVETPLVLKLLLGRTTR